MGKKRKQKRDTLALVESPAQVLNLSLGGTIFEACPAELDETFAFLASLGVTTVVSAGNNGSPSDINFPASCPSVRMYSSRMAETRAWVRWG